MGLVNEFKQFAIKGNVVDMAVGIIIGGAFGKIVTSMVNDVVMPVVGALTPGGGSLGGKFFWMSGGPKPATIEAAKEAGGAYVAWGPFLQTTLDFIILALAIFVMIKAMNRLREAVEGTPEAAAPAQPPEDVRLLREIRDALKQA